LSDDEKLQNHRRFPSNIIRKSFMFYYQFY